MRLRLVPYWSAPWFAAAALAAPRLLHAQGFALSEIGSCAVGRGFAVTAAGCGDATDIYWNPAALVGRTGATVTLGAADVAVRGGFTQDSTGRRYPGNVPNTLVPHLFLNYSTGRLALGLGVYVPYGLTSQWNGDFPGRFQALKASLQSIYVQPNVAIRLAPGWSVGGGPVFGRSTVELVQGLDLSQQVAAVQNGQPVTFGQLGFAAGTEFGRARLKGSATAVGFNVGLHGAAGPWALGARYLSALDFRYDRASVTFAQRPTGLVLAANNPLGFPSGPLDPILAGQFSSAGPLAAQTGSSEIRHPWQAQGGVAFTGLPGTTLSADLTRTGWSSFNTLPITFSGNARSQSRSILEGYRDSWSYRFGAAHTLQGPGTFAGWTARAGYSYAQTPAPDVTVTPLLPDMDRQNYAVGLGIPIGPGRLDAAYLYVYTPGRRGRIVERTLPTETAAQLNSGAYDLRASVISATYTVSF